MAEKNEYENPGAKDIQMFWVTDGLSHWMHLRPFSDAMFFFMYLTF